MDFGSNLLYFVSILIQVFACGLGLYYFGVSLFAWIPKKALPDIDVRDRRYALIVAAHNEEAVIKYMVESLKKLDYDDDKYKIFVIADNCTDNTAKYAAEAGAEVFERFHDTLRGKGHALEWMFEKIYNMDEKFDSICIFDADKIIDRADFTACHERAEGLNYVLINGSVVVENAVYNGTRAGKVLV